MSTVAQNTAATKRRFRTRYAIWVGGLVALVFAWVLLRSLLAPRVAPDVILGNGSIEGTEQTVSSKLPGRISSLNVDEGSRVRIGSLLATVDSDEIRARLQQAESQVLAAHADVLQATAAADELRNQDLQTRTAATYASASTAAAIAQAAAANTDAIARAAQAGSAIDEARHSAHAATEAYRRAARDYERAQALVASGDISRRDYDAARYDYEAALAQRDAARLAVQRSIFGNAQASAAVQEAQSASDQARAQRYSVLLKQQDITSAQDRLRRGAAQVAIAQAQYQAALANRDAVRAEVNDTRLTAPSDGVILRVISQNGEVIAAGTPVVTLVDTTKLYVRIYLSEIDAGRTRIGDAAAITVDAFPGRSFSGTVSQIDESAQFTPKTVHMADERTRLVYGVKIAIENYAGELKPGMIADARIRIESAKP